MSKPKKLDLEFSELVKITKAINKNALANKSRSKDKRIKTDKFLKDTFNINRKDFSFTIQDTPIKYNPSTFLYLIPKEYQSNTNTTTEEIAVTVNEPSQGNTKELLKNLLKEEYPEFEEMLEWYRSYKGNTAAVINLDNPKLTGDIISKSFKTYESVLNDFISFCKNKKQTQKDLIALALTEFMEHYK